MGRNNSLQHPRPLPHPAFLHLNPRVPDLLPAQQRVVQRHGTGANFLAGPVAPDEVLQREPKITRSLEHTTRLESPGDFAAATREEKPHLERVADDPVYDDAGPEPFTSAPGVVGVELWERQGGFDGECHGAQDIRVRDEQARRAHEQVQDQQRAGEVAQERPVRPRLSPLPEIIGPFARPGRDLKGQV